MKTNPIIAMDECVVLYDANKINEGKFNARKFLSNLLKIKTPANLINFLYDKNTLLFADYINRREGVWNIKNEQEKFDFSDNSHLDYLINTDKFENFIVNKAHLEYLDEETDLSDYFGYSEYINSSFHSGSATLERETEDQRKTRNTYCLEHGKNFEPNLKFISLFELAAIKNAVTLLIELHAISCNKYENDSLFHPIEDIKDDDLLEQVNSVGSKLQPLYMVDISFFTRYPFLAKIDAQELIYDLALDRVRYKRGSSKSSDQPALYSDFVFVYEGYTNYGLTCDKAAIKRSASGSIVATVLNELERKSARNINRRYSNGKHELLDESESEVMRLLYSEIVTIIDNVHYGFCEICGKPLIHLNVTKGKEKRLTCSDICRARKKNIAKAKRS